MLVWALSLGKLIATENKVTLLNSSGGLLFLLEAIRAATCLEKTFMLCFLNEVAQFSRVLHGSLCHVAGVQILEGLDG
jgi:hypothetical protein